MKADSNKKHISRSPHLQCTIMGRFPDCCCCLCTAAIMSIIPLPSAGIPISGHPWKWKCRTCCKCFSWWGAENSLKLLWNISGKLHFKSAKANILTLKKTAFFWFYLTQTSTYWPVGEHHVFQTEGLALCVCSQLNGVISKCYTALWWPILVTLFLKKSQNGIPLSSIFFTINALFVSIFQDRRKHTKPKEENKTVT